MLISSLFVLTFTITCTEAQTKKKCPTVSSTRFSRDSASEIIDALALKNTDIIAVIADESSLAQKLYEFAPIKEILLFMKDQELCEDFESIINQDTQGENQPRVQVIFSDLSEIDISSAQAIIVTALDIDLKKLTQKVAQLPDGVRLLIRDQLEYDPALHLETIRTIALSPTQGITMYEYVVKRPTVADLLNELYIGMTGFGISQEEADEIRKAGGDPTYGEIELSSAEKIFTELVPIGPSDVFYDLGCGIGKLALWVYLATPAKKISGIELCGSRFEQAVKAKKLMEEKILPKRKAIMLADWGDKASRKTLSVTCGNIADADLRDATIIYMCSTCYPDTLMQTMVDKFIGLNEGLRIVTLKELPTHPSIHLIGKPQRFPMTWSPERGSPVYIYEMRHPQLKDVLDHAYGDFNGLNTSVEDKEKEVVADEDTAPSGEITYESAKKLLKNILRLEPDDVFYDLGSEAGKLAIHAYLETPVKKVIGIESSKSQLQSAELAKKRMTELLSVSPYDSLWEKTWNNAETKVLEFHNKETFDTSFTDATKTFIGSTFFLKDVLTNLCTTIPTGARVVSLQKLQGCPKLTLVKTHQLTTSWSKDVSVYEYVVKTQPIPVKAINHKGSVASQKSKK
jgi:precorrin-6B methylase 2